MTTTMKTVAAGAVVYCVLAALPAQAQTNCQSFRVLLQASLNLAIPPPEVPWSGQVRGFLNGAEPLAGTLSYLPGAESRRTGQAGHESNDRAKFDFGPKGVFVTEAHSGPKGVFVTEAHSAVFPLRPDVSAPCAFGKYVATTKVAPDPLVSRGRFANATGNISILGMFLVDFLSPVSAGVWNAEIEGTLCNVAP